MRLVVKPSWGLSQEDMKQRTKIVRAVRRCKKGTSTAKASLSPAQVLLTYER